MYDKHDLAAVSTGNNTHTSVPMGASQQAIIFKFIVTAAGATPTVTWKVQGSADGTDVSDANSTWYDVGYITDASDTISQATRTATAVGQSIGFLSNPVARVYRKYRLVTTLNTNVTYRAEIVRAR